MKNGVRLAIFLVSALFIGVINGLFGGGGGLLGILLLKFVLKTDDKVAHSTTIPAMGIISLPTLISYCTSISFNIFVVLIVAVGSVIGSIIGSFVLKKISPKLLNILLIIVLLFSGIKMFL